MKNDIRFFASIICIALWYGPVQAATKYWDTDGVTLGAGGATPSGTWDSGTTANWTTDSTGASVGTTWTDGDDAVFSAGTDAVGEFSVIMNSPQIAGNLTVKEGAIVIGFESGFYPYLDVGGSVAGKGIIDIASGLNATINTPLAGGDDRGQLTKTGAGTLTLGGANGMATNVVMEGVLAVANNVALGDTTVPTIVSNGASLLVTGGASGMGEGVILNGSGIANNGALRSSAGALAWTGGAELGSDARIETGGGDFIWTAYPIKGTNGGNNFNLTIGGNGGRVRLNQTILNGPDAHNRSLQLGAGVLIKEGTCLLQLENPNIFSALFFNGGSIYPRYPGFGTNSTIYIGGAGGTFAALFQNITLDKNLSVATGAEVGFNCNQVQTPQPTAYNCTNNGVISGLGGLSKTNTGVLTLTKANTYSGNTTIQLGPLSLGTSGSISNSTVINVWGNAFFDVSAVANGFVLQTAQTLKGNGTVLGNVNAKGTIAPGASIGSLTNDGNLTLGGNILIEVDKSQSPASNDLITVTGTLSHGGGASLTVVNLGPTLATNDSFQIFSKPVTGGGTINVTGGGASWTNRLALDGSIAVLSVSPKVAATNLTIQAIGPTSRTVGGSGAGNSAYNVYASTNVALPMSSWWLIGTTNSTAGGLIQFLDTQATNVQRFYRFGQ